MQWIGVAIVVMGGVIVLAWYLSNRFGDELTSVSDHVDTIDDNAPTESASIPLRTRVASISTTGKVMFGSLAILILAAAFFTFRVFRTGSPAEFAYTQYVVYGALVLGGSVAGVIGKGIAERNEGTLYVKTEGPNGDVRNVEKIPVDVQAIDADSDGNPVVTEYKRRRVAGLFRRHRHVGEDYDLQATDRPEDKTIQHQLPDFAVELDDNVWSIRTQGRDAVSTPGEKPDYVYRQPIEMEYSEYVDKRTENRRLKIRMKGIQSELSAVTREMNRLRRMVESGKYKQEEQVMDKIEDVFDMVEGVLHDSNDFGGGGAEVPQGPRTSHVTVGSDTSASGQESARTDGGEQS